MNEWISVKDLLPPVNQNVLFLNGKQEVVFGFFRPDPPPVDNWATLDSIWINDMSYDVIGNATHWMPLPEPPKPEKTYSFMEILKDLDQGKIFRRCSWHNKTYYICNYPPGIGGPNGRAPWLQAQDFEGKDWIEVKRDEME